VPVGREACPLNLAPMASTTATLALGDALAAALMERKGFTAEDFARFHPAGSLGRQLTWRVEDLMLVGDSVPRVGTDTLMREALLEITGKGLGFTGVFDATGGLAGIVTDGDLRRCLQRADNFLDLTAREVMTPNPKCVGPEILAVEALRLMERYAITSLFVVGEKEEGGARGTGLSVVGGRSSSLRGARGTGPSVVGVLHIHDLVRAGLR